MSSPIRNEAEQKTFCFVPIPSVERWRSQSRVKMNVLRTPLTVLSIAQRCCRGESSTAATSALTFMTFS
jgi:hypothetical protein